MNSFKTILLVILITVSLSVLCHAKPATLNRADIPDIYKWNFADIYSDWAAWEKDITITEQKMSQYVSLKGTLSKSPEALLAVLKLDDEISIITGRISRYVSLQATVNTKDRELQAKRQRIRTIYNKFSQATAWFEPEMLSIPQSTIDSWMVANTELRQYKMYINDIFHSKEHVLPEDKEILLSYFSTPLGTISSAYSQLTTADMEYPKVTVSTGETITLTEGNYSRLLKDEKLSQEDRKKAYIAMQTSYKKNLNTYATLYAGVCQRDWANARARNYPSSLDAKLFGNNIPMSVYENLIQTARNNTAVLKRYMNLKKKLIMKQKNLKEYWSYDTSLSFTDYSKDYPYEIGKEIVYNAVAPLGKEYQSRIRTALDNRWVDVYENDGKDTGASSGGLYGVHPFIKMNYNDTMDNMFTLAHELGHSMHSVYANETQPYTTTGYTTFVAEVASTFNEQLLIDYLLSKTKDPKERIAILRQAIGNITGTFFFQTFLADFELQVHKLAEQGKPITADTLIAIERDLDNIYYGDYALRIDEFEGISWSMVPHLFGPSFYVYQYATSFAASSKLYKDMTTGSSTQKEAARKRYIELLKSGGKDYPIELLKTAGVDMSKPDAVLAVISELDRLVTLLEKEVNKL